MSREPTSESQVTYLHMYALEAVTGRGEREIKMQKLEATKVCSTRLSLAHYLAVQFYFDFNLQDGFYQQAKLSSPVCANLCLDAS